MIAALAAADAVAIAALGDLTVSADACCRLRALAAGEAIALQGC
jgi:hypothetical protein